MNIIDQKVTDIFNCEQTGLWMVQSVPLSVRTFVSVTPFSLCCQHRIVVKFWGVITIDRSNVHTKGLRSKVKATEVKTNVATIRAFPDSLFEFTDGYDGYDMMHKFRTGTEKVPYSFSRSSINFQGHTGLNIADFDLN